MSGFWQRVFGGGTPATERGPAASVRGPDEVRLEPAIPGMLDGDEVVMGHPVLGVYALHTGEEVHAMSASVTRHDGSQERVGIGSKLALAGGTWIVTGFESEDTMVLGRSESVDLDALVLPTTNPVVYPDAEVSNLWVQIDQPVATWVADLTNVARQDPGALSGFVDALLCAGKQTGVLHIHENKEMGFRELEDGDFGEWLSQRRSEGAPPDLLGSTGGISMTAQMAFFDASGRLIEHAVGRLERILGREEPYDGAFDGFMEHHPPISLVGTTAEGVAAAAAGDWDRPVQLRLVLHSDIWFPWINGSCHPLCDYEREFDNRLLAERHTPRLNAFLEAVAAAAEALGGTFGLDTDETNVPPAYATDRGIVLDGPQPAAVFTEEDRNVDWE